MQLTSDKVTNYRTIRSTILQVTTHSHLLSGEEVEQLGDALGYGDCISWFLLQEFDTELDFFNKVRLV